MLTNTDPGGSLTPTERVTLDDLPEFPALLRACQREVMKLMRVGSQIVELRARASPGSYIFPVAKTQGYVAAIVLCEYILAVDRGRTRGEKRRATYTTAASASVRLNPSRPARVDFRSRNPKRCVCSKGLSRPAGHE